MGAIAELKHKFNSVWPLLDERTRRIMAASEAIGLGYGGVSMVRRACGLSRKAIAKGITEIQAQQPLLGNRIRRPGAGRKQITLSAPELLTALDSLIEGGDAWRPGISLALDLQKHSHAGRAVNPGAASDQLCQSRPNPA